MKFEKGTLVMTEFPRKMYGKVMERKNESGAMVLFYGYEAPCYVPDTDLTENTTNNESAFMLTSPISGRKYQAFTSIGTALQHFVNENGLTLPDLMTLAEGVNGLWKYCQTEDECGSGIAILSGKLEGERVYAITDQAAGMVISMKSLLFEKVNLDEMAETELDKECVNAHAEANTFNIPAE